MCALSHFFNDKNLLSYRENGCEYLYRIHGISVTLFDVLRILFHCNRTATKHLQLPDALLVLVLVPSSHNHKLSALVLLFRSNENVLLNCVREVRCRIHNTIEWTYLRTKLEACHSMCREVKKVREVSKEICYKFVGAKFLVTTFACMCVVCACQYFRQRCWCWCWCFYHVHTTNKCHRVMNWTNRICFK